MDGYGLMKGAGMTVENRFAGASRAPDYVEDDSPAKGESSALVSSEDADVERTSIALAHGDSAPGLEPFSKGVVIGGVEIPPEVERVLDRAPASEGWRGGVNSLSGGTAKLAPSPAEWRTRIAAARVARAEKVIRRTTWTRAAGILVANRKGNAGKTPTSIALGGVISSIRGGSVAIMEVSDDRGQLFYRAEGSPLLGMGELVENIAAITNQGQLKGYTAPQESFASVIGTSGFRPAMTEQNVIDVSKVIDVYFDIRLMDSGNQYTSSAFAGAVRTADMLIIPTMNSADSIFDALDLIDFLRNSQDPHQRMLAETALVVRLSDGRPELKAQRVLSYFHDKGIPDDRIFEVPFDRHIADRDEINVKFLDAKTRDAFALIGAAAVDQISLNITER